MKATFKRHILNFKRPSGTSRGVMIQKETWFLLLTEAEKIGIGECGLLRGLSCDDRVDYEEKLGWLCNHINTPFEQLWYELREFPSLQFGLEQALRSLRSENPFELFPSDFTKNEAPIAINGLVWMGNKEFMQQQIDEKLAQGFHCLKMKVGAIDFETEWELLRSIRKKYSKDQLELRVDANGAFTAENALQRLERLAALDIHSIEQPVRQGQWKLMANLCSQSPLPIALDEELIGVFDLSKKEELIRHINPQYLIFKPSLIGGYKGVRQWIAMAERQQIGWWVTSALEGNIGLNAIAQWTFTLNNTLPQGLGTGSLFTNNFDSPLQVVDGQLFYRKHLSWRPNLIKDLCI